jgi:hypothetical protein
MTEEIIIEKKKPQFGKVIIVVLISVVVFAIIIGYILRKNNFDSPDAPVAETAIIENSITTVSPDASATTNTASWKTYTNDTYGFSFQYPSNWTEKTLAESAQVIVSSADTTDLVDKGELHSAYANNLVITRYPSINEDNARGGSSIYMKESYANLKEYVSDQNALKRKTGETVIDGKTAYEVGIIGYGANFGIMLEKENNIYEFSFERKASRSELSNEENLILSSFKFTK